MFSLINAYIAPFPISHFLCAPLVQRKKNRVLSVYLQEAGSITLTDSSCSGKGRRECEKIPNVQTIRHSLLIRRGTPDKCKESTSKGKNETHC